MPEYLAPGVYVEEVSYRAKSIEGVSTTTTGFVGPTRYGPVDLPLDVVTGLGEFERVYGDRQQMQFGASPTHNYLWHAARAFFEEGGKRLYVARVFKELAAGTPQANKNGIAKASIGALKLCARFPGAGGNMRVRVTLTAGANVLALDPPIANPVPAVRGVLETDVVMVNRVSSPPTPGVVAAVAHSFFDTASGLQSWRFDDGSATGILLSTLDPRRGDTVQVITATVSVYPTDANLSPWVYSGLALDINHQLSGAYDSVEAQFRPYPPQPGDPFEHTPLPLGQARTIPIVITMSGAHDGAALLKTLLSADAGLAAELADPKSTAVNRSIDVMLTGGNDGQRPGADEYEGFADVASTRKTGLKMLEDLDDISIVAAPGSTFGYGGGYHDDASTILNLLIAHAASMRYRIAVLDSGENQSVADVRDLRARIDSTYAALYYPWVTILDPVTGTEINLPPSGFVCGIYARNDINRAVYKAPANEVVNLAIGFETLLNKAQQDVLNPLGVNCFRFFEGRGYRLWGARTVSSDPEWKYVNLRRYFAYLEHSIDKGTQWAVFEPNGDQLWSNVRRTISDFLLNEWQTGALLGDKPEKAFFVRCDRSTMTQNDLDNGRLVCLIGVAPLRPAEYVIFRIGQWTADAKS